jgi:hypothetical protein
MVEGSDSANSLASIYAIVQVGFARRVLCEYTDLPGLQGAVAPYLPPERLQRYSPPIGSFDADRGCPIPCSFRTIINVQGRKSRYRSADDIEQLLRAHLAKGVTRFFITDDDFVRNRYWEEILDRAIALRESESESENIPFTFLIQVDALAYRLPNFIDKCKRAGCRWIFIGLETINAANLKHANKRQNKFGEYRTMLQAWSAAGIITFCGYILGFPEDTVGSIEHDIEIIQRELPVDVLEFFCLTPLPGSKDHQNLYRAGIAMDRDMNKYDLEHIRTEHSRMTRDEWQGVYDWAWLRYYSLEHVETLLRRAATDDMPVTRLMHSLPMFRAMLLIEGVHPLQGGYFRRKIYRTLRPGSPQGSTLLFYLLHFANSASKTVLILHLLWNMDRCRRRIVREHVVQPYTDVPIPKLEREADGQLEMMRERPALEVAHAAE